MVEFVGLCMLAIGGFSVIAGGLLFFLGMFITSKGSGASVDALSWFIGEGILFLIISGVSLGLVYGGYIFLVAGRELF